MKYFYEGFCADSMTYYPIDRLIPGLPPNQIGILMIIAGFMNIIASLITVIWIKRKEREAQAEDGADDAAKSVIFPVFVKLLWISIVVNIYAGAVITVVPFDPVGHNSGLSSNLYASMSAFQHFIIEGTTFLLMQKGCGSNAGKIAFKCALIWAINTYIMKYFIFTSGGWVGNVIEMVWNFIMAAFYIAVWVVPQKNLYRRPAAIYYAKFWTYYRALAVIITIMMFVRATADLGSCGYIIVQVVLFSVIEPFVVYWTLLQDSRWWQGLDVEEQASRHASYEDIRSPLLGTDFSLTSAQSLAATMDHIRLQGSVKMLNFACIKIDFRRHLGSGSFSKVYRGSYRRQDCAIKLIYTVDLTADIIRRVAAEASILSSIRHPNVVHIYGVSVLPPSVCLILELCSFGSLSDIIRGYGFDWSTSQRYPLSLHRLDCLYLALGCARGLAAVHNFDPSLCHRDVKSFNFLVDGQLNVKIADLELGLKSKDSTEQVVVEELLANWMAPEVITNKKYQQASDIFSLGTVLWEIISKQLPFETDTQAEIRTKILEGYKHPIPENEIGSILAVIIVRCWCMDPTLRPSADEIVSELERMIVEYGADLIGEVESCPSLKTLRDFYEAAYRKSGTYSDLSTPSIFTLTHRSNFSWWNPFSWFHSNNYEREFSFLDGEAPALSLPKMPHEKSKASSRAPSFFSSRTASRAPKDAADDEDFSIPLPPGATEAIRAIKKEQFWGDLEVSGDPWVLVTRDSPHIIIHATSKWYELFEISSYFGTDFQLMSLLSMIAPEVEAAPSQCTGSNNYVISATQSGTYNNMRISTAKELLAGLKSHKAVHGVLCLHMPVLSTRFISHSVSFSGSSNQASLDSTGKLRAHNLMASIHAYPIFTKHKVDYPSILASKSSSKANLFNDDSSVDGLIAEETINDTASNISFSARSVRSLNSFMSSKSPKPSASHPPQPAKEIRKPAYYAILFNELTEKGMERENCPPKVSGDYNSDRSGSTWSTLNLVKSFGKYLTDQSRLESSEGLSRNLFDNLSRSSSGGSSDYYGDDEENHSFSIA